LEIEQGEKLITSTNGTLEIPQILSNQLHPFREYTLNDGADSKIPTIFE
jgi:hypothetical protein